MSESKFFLLERKKPFGYGRFKADIDHARVGVRDVFFDNQDKFKKGNHSKEIIDNVECYKFFDNIICFYYNGFAFVCDCGFSKSSSTTSAINGFLSCIINYRNVEKVYEVDFDINTYYQKDEVKEIKKFVSSF